MPALYPELLIAKLASSEQPPEHLVLNFDIVLTRG